MRFLKTLVFASLLISSSLKAQTEYKNREFSFTNENDVYLLLGIDRYYSNGLFLNYRFVNEGIKLDTIRPKRVFDIGIAQKFWTPQDLRIINPGAYYRPYAGMLYASFSVGEFIKKFSRFSYGVDIGIIGKGSGAQAFQEWYHKTLGFPEPRGWRYQIPNGLVFDLKLEYNRQYELVPKRVDLISSTSASLGSGFSHVIQRVDIRFGDLRPLNQSAFFNAIIGSGSSSLVTHKYFFIGYGVEGVLHNSTIEGHVFTNDAPQTNEIMPFVRHLRLGWAKSSENSTLKITYNWLSQEVRGGAGRHAYFALELQLRFASKS